MALPVSFTITYKLTNSDGFYAELQSTYGIGSSWVQFTDAKDRFTNDCDGGDLPHGSRPRCIYINILRSGYPMSSGNITVANPKDIINNALPTIAKLQVTIVSRQLDLVTSSWWGPTDDILQVVSMPVMMIVQAVKSMAP
jgi:glucan 1,3-beta-glucosidase